MPAVTTPPPRDNSAIQYIAKHFLRNNITLAENHCWMKLCPGPQLGTPRSGSGLILLPLHHKLNSDRSSYSTFPREGFARFSLSGVGRLPNQELQSYFLSPCCSPGKSSPDSLSFPVQVSRAPYDEGFHCLISHTQRRLLKF